MSRYRSDPETLDYDRPSACAKCWSYTWRTITCLFSHITLVSMVVSYCALGAFTFESLEVEHERMVKKNISFIRENTTDFLWNLTKGPGVLIQYNYTEDAKVFLKDFEVSLVRAMTKDGWNGEEDLDKVQWTRTGALFYSIIVITTIGYGHITPKTVWGKVATIFYAILGIPLMLLCLSNIGDIMATSFRFLYWRVCCYVCTKPKKPKRSRSVRSNYRSADRFSRNRNSLRKSGRTSTRSADSGFAVSDMAPTSHSDSELWAPEDVYEPRRGASMPRMRPSQVSRYSDSTVQQRKSSNQQRPQFRGHSLDRKKFQKDVEIELDPIILSRTPILCNKYVVGKNELLGTNVPGITVREFEGQGRASPLPRRAISMPRTSHYLEAPRYPSPEFSDREDDADSVRRKRKRKSPAPLSPSPKMMTPLGYGHRSKYLDDPESDEDYYDDVYYDSERQRIRPVPIWLCVFLVVSYIIAGAFLFEAWEQWGYLDAAYFCFVTLTTIGFGDFVPAKGVTQDTVEETTTAVTISIALCSLYLLFGISLLAMSFNLVQEEVINNVKRIAQRLGIIKGEEEDSDEDI